MTTPAFEKRQGLMLCTCLLLCSSFLRFSTTSVTFNALSRKLQPLYTYSLQYSDDPYYSAVQWVKIKVNFYFVATMSIIAVVQKHFGCLWFGAILNMNASI